MNQLPVIGGVVAAAVVVLLALVLYMVYGKKSKEEEVHIVEERGSGSIYSDQEGMGGHDHFDEMHAAQHQQEVEYYEQQRNEDDFRERESGGVDLVFNPAHSPFAPPGLPQKATRRITLQQPTAGKPYANQSEAGSVVGGSIMGGSVYGGSVMQSQALPAARRITIIAKPPVGGVPPPPTSSPTVGRASPSGFQQQQLPPPGAMKPIYGRGPQGHYGHDDL